MLHSWQRVRTRAAALRLLVVVSWIAMVFASRFAAGQGVPPDARPNLIVILADDLGYGDLSCYGNDRYATPNLDQLAAEGLRFTDFHSNGPVCSPTRAALLTGRYQQRAGLPEVVNADGATATHHQGLQTAEVTFAEGLRERGYATALIGKWHLGYTRRYNPVHHGFDRFRGYVSGNIDYRSHVDRMGRADWWDGLNLEEESGYTTHLITRHALEFIRSNRDRPFCLYVAHEAVHDPYQGPTDPALRVAGKAGTRRVGGESIARAYREMAEAMDEGVGELVAELRRLHLEKRTLVFFMSDNGANRNGNNGSLRGYKGSVWEGGHRVPAIAWWPGIIEPGTVTDALALTMDVMPTLLELAGAETPNARPPDGVSLAPLLRGEEPRTDRAVFWEFRGRSAMREGKWKLVSESLGETSASLYDLQNDLAEQENLAARYPARVRNMRERLASWSTDVASNATDQPEPPKTVAP